MVVTAAEKRGEAAKMLRRLHRIIFAGVFVGWILRSGGILQVAGVE